MPSLITPPGGGKSKVPTGPRVQAHALDRYRELSAPGRHLNVFESLELETLERHFGQLQLPLTMSKSKDTIAQLLAPQQGEQILTGSHRLIIPSKTNRTLTEADWSDLLPSIKEHGIFQPLIVRPRSKPGSLGEDIAIQTNGALYEIVAGERRWRCAAKLDLQNVPFLVREYDDRQALEIQKLENLQRKNLDPIEEGRGFRQMMDEFGYTLEDLRTKLGKEKSWIYGRIKLARLVPGAIAAWRAHWFPESVAVRIARMPAAMQERLLDLGREENEFCEENPLTDDRAAELIEEKFMRQLKGAPFDQKDPDLVPVDFHKESPESKTEVRCFGGACTDCPMRSGNQPDYNPKTHGRGDMCLHPACYKAKAEAALKVKAEATGSAVLLNPETLDSLFHEPWNATDDGMYGGQPYGAASHPMHDLKPLPGTKESAPTMEAVAKHFDIKPIYALQPYTGKVIELYDREVLVMKAREAKLIDRSSASRGASNAGAFKKAAAETRRKNVVRAKVTAALLQKCDALSTQAKAAPQHLQVLRFIAASLANDASADQARAIVARRQLPKPAKKTLGVWQRDALKDLPKSFEYTSDFSQFFLELAITPRFAGYAGDSFKLAADALGLDLKKLEKAAAGLEEDGKHRPRTTIAEVKEALKVAKPAKHKGISPEGLARIKAAQKARWKQHLAKSKAGKGNK